MPGFCIGTSHECIVTGRMQSKRTRVANGMFITINYENIT